MKKTFIFVVLLLMTGIFSFPADESTTWEGSCINAKGNNCLSIYRQRKLVWVYAEGVEADTKLLKALFNMKKLKVEELGKYKDGIKGRVFYNGKPLGQFIFEYFYDPNSQNYFQTPGIVPVNADEGVNVLLDDSNGKQRLLDINKLDITYVELLAYKSKKKLADGKTEKAVIIELKFGAPEGGVIVGPKEKGRIPLPVKFGGVIDALNYMQKKGWTFMTNYALSHSDGQVYHFILKRTTTMSKQ